MYIQNKLKYKNKREREYNLNLYVCNCKVFFFFFLILTYIYTGYTVLVNNKREKKFVYSNMSWKENICPL